MEIGNLRFQVGILRTALVVHWCEVKRTRRIWFDCKNTFVCTLVITERPKFNWRVVTLHVSPIGAIIVFFNFTFFVAFSGAKGLLWKVLGLDILFAVL